MHFHTSLITISGRLVADDVYYVVRWILSEHKRLIMCIDIDLDWWSATSDEILEKSCQSRFPFDHSSIYLKHVYLCTTSIDRRSSDNYRHWSSLWSIDRGVIDKHTPRDYLPYRNNSRDTFKFVFLTADILEFFLSLSSQKSVAINLHLDTSIFKRNFFFPCLFLIFILVLPRSLQNLFFFYEY